jgi:hypothetical protein
MRSLLIIFACLLTSLTLKAQKIVDPAGAVIYIYSEDDKPDERRGSYTAPHILGDEILRLANKIERTYVFYTPSGGAYSVEEKKINKPAIYNAYKKIDKHYTKQVQSGNIHQVYAAEELKEVYEVIFRLLNYETSSLEKDLKKIKDPESLVAYFKEVKFRR